MTRRGGAGDIPGTIYRNKNRWWWKVRFPGEDRYSYLPLKPEGARWATTHHATAVEVARRLWAARTFDGTPGRLAEGNGHAGRPRTVADLTAAFLSHARTRHQRGGRATSEPACCRAAMAYMVAQCGPRLPDDVALADLEAARERMIAAGLSRTTINGYVARIRRAFRWAARRRLCLPAGAAEMDLLDGLQPGIDRARDPDPVRGVPPKDLAEVRARLAPTLRDMVNLALATAMRPGEVCRLRATEVTRGRGLWHYRPLEHKTAWRGHQRVVPLGPRARKILRPYLERESERYCFEPEDVQRKRGGLQARGGRAYQSHYSAGSWRRAIHRVIDAINAERRAALRRRGKDESEAALMMKWGPNRLRHSAATEIRRRFGRDHARAALGQRSSRVVDVYAEIDERLAEEAARRRG